MIGQLEKEITNNFTELNELIREFDVEIRNCNVETKKINQEKLIEYKRNFESLKNEFQSKKRTLNRNNLVGGRSETDQQRFENVNDQLKRQNEVLQTAIRTVAETEDVGSQIVGQLEDNTGKIISTKSKVSLIR